MSADAGLVALFKAELQLCKVGPGETLAVLTEDGAVGEGTGEVTSHYGPRLHPILKYVKVHTGTDFGAGDGIVYAADAVVYETVPASRARLAWLLRRWYRTGNIEAALYLRGRRRDAWRRPANVLRGLARVAAGSGLFLANLAVLGLGRKDRIVRPLYTVCRGCGILASTLGWNYSEYIEVHGG